MVSIYQKKRQLRPINKKVDTKTQKATKIVLYISIATALITSIAGAMLFQGPIAIGIFFGLILGFFFPWVIALIAYSIYMMSNPLAGFKDEIDKLNKRP